MDETTPLSAGDYDKKRPDPGEQLIKVQQVVLHPHFHSYTFDSDIALLYLARPVVRGPTAIPACLPDAHLSRYLLRVNDPVWSTTRPSVFLCTDGLFVCSGGQQGRGDGMGCHTVPGQVLSFPQEGGAPGGQPPRLHHVH